MNKQSMFLTTSHCGLCVTPQKLRKESELNHLLTKQLLQYSDKQQNLKQIIYYLIKMPYKSNTVIFLNRLIQSHLIFTPKQITTVSGTLNVDIELIQGINKEISQDYFLKINYLNKFDTVFSQYVSLIVFSAMIYVHLPYNCHQLQFFQDQIQQNQFQKHLQFQSIANHQTLFPNIICYFYHYFLLNNHFLSYRFLNQLMVYTTTFNSSNHLRLVEYYPHLSLPDSLYQNSFTVLIYCKSIHLNIFIVLLIEQMRTVQQPCHCYYFSEQKTIYNELVTIPFILASFSYLSAWFEIILFLEMGRHQFPITFLKLISIRIVNNIEFYQQTNIITFQMIGSLAQFMNVKENQGFTLKQQLSLRLSHIKANNTQVRRNISLQLPKNHIPDDKSKLLEIYIKNKDRIQRQKQYKTKLTKKYKTQLSSNQNYDEIPKIFNRVLNNTKSFFTSSIPRKDDIAKNNLNKDHNLLRAIIKTQQLQANHKSTTDFDDCFKNLKAGLQKSYVIPHISDNFFNPSPQDVNKFQVPKKYGRLLKNSVLKKYQNKISLKQKKIQLDNCIKWAKKREIQSFQFCKIVQNGWQQQNKVKALQLKQFLQNRKKYMDKIDGKVKSYSFIM